MNTAALQCNAVVSSPALPSKSRGMRGGSETSAIVIACAYVAGPRQTVAWDGGPDWEIALGWGSKKSRRAITRSS